MNLLKLLRLAPGPFRGTPHACTVLTAETQRPAIRKLNSDAQPAPVRIAVSGEGKRLEAVWGSGSPPSTYHSVWLRHNCQCSQCSSHGQNTVSSTDTDPNVAVADANITEEGSVKVRWSCGHEGQLNIDWLRKHCYSSQSLHKAMKNGLPATTHISLPQMEVGELDDDHGLWRWLKNLNEGGMCLLTGAKPEAECVVKIAHKVSHVQKSIYGKVSDITIKENPISVSFSDSPLELHVDLPYYASLPGVILLLCVRNDECVEGGEAIVVDGLAALEHLRHTHPHHFSTLARVPATYHRVHYSYERDDPVHMIHRTPHIQLNGKGQIIQFRWAPHCEGPLQVPEEDVMPYYEAHACLAKTFTQPQFKIIHRLQPGDLLTVNNHRMLHGRTSIKLNGGTRHLKSVYVNIDEFKSKFLVLCSRFAPDYAAKHVLNGDYGF